jgi:perosamine synthetase
MIPVSIPYIAKNQKSYVNDCLDRNWISAFGKYDKSLCSSFANYIGSNYASTCSNGTVAIHLALLAAEIKPGDEVILPNFNSPYALFAIGYVKAIPVLIDINEDWDIDIDVLENAVSPLTKAIIIPHLYGVPSKIKPLKDFLINKKIVIIEDCAEAHGAMEDNDKVGSIGDIGCFSFYSNKIIASGEGGICTTSSEEIFNRINYYKNQTFNNGPIKTFIHNDIGYNYRMSDLHCAIAFSHLEEIDYILEKRWEILNKYKYFLDDYLDAFQIQKKSVQTVNWITTFELNNSKLNFRDDLVKFLINKNIEVRQFFAPMNNQPIFINMGGRISGSLRVSELVASSGLYLPTFIGMEKKQIQEVSDKIKLFFENNNYKYK